MRLLIKLAIVALVVHAAFRAGNAYWNYYRFEDALQELAQFGDRKSDKQLCDQAIDAASGYDIPIAADAISVRRGNNAEFNCATGPTGAGLEPMPVASGQQLFINAKYRQDILLFPGYRYPWDFTLNVKAWIRL